MTHVSLLYYQHPHMSPREQFVDVYSTADRAKQRAQKIENTGAALHGKPVPVITWHEMGTDILGFSSSGWEYRIEASPLDPEIEVVP